MVGVMHPQTIQAAAGMAATAVNPVASMETTNVERGPVTTVWTQMPVRTQVVATVLGMHPTLRMAGVMAPPTTLAVAGMVAIVVNLHVLTEPIRVALWDTLVTIQTHVKTVPVVALSPLGINLTSTEQNTYKSSPNYT